MAKDNITFIGMPGSGKSVVGQKLATKLQYDFLDVDDVIMKQAGLKLQEFLDKFGDEKFMQIEEQAVMGLGNLRNTIISPGGSIVYSEPAMNFLKDISALIFLDAPYEKIEESITNLEERGITGLKTKNLKQLYEERVPLYRKFTDITIAVTDDLDVDSVLEKIEQRLKM